MHRKAIHLMKNLYFFPMLMFTQINLLLVNLFIILFGLTWNWRSYQWGLWRMQLLIQGNPRQGSLHKTSTTRKQGTNYLCRSEVFLNAYLCLAKQVFTYFICTYFYTKHFQAQIAIQKHFTMAQIICALCLVFQQLQ